MFIEENSLFLYKVFREILRFSQNERKKFRAQYLPVLNCIEIVKRIEFKYWSFLRVEALIDWSCSLQFSADGWSLLQYLVNVKDVFHTWDMVTVHQPWVIWFTYLAGEMTLMGPVTYCTALTQVRWVICYSDYVNTTVSTPCYGIHRYLIFNQIILYIKRVSF